jgi:hypothetical protein
LTAQAIGAFARHLGLAGEGAMPMSTKSITIPLGPTIGRGGGNVIQAVWVTAAIALLAVMLWKFTL